MEDGEPELTEPALFSGRGRIGQLQLVAYTPAILIFHFALATFILTEIFGSHVVQISFAMVVGPWLNFVLSPIGFGMALCIFVHHFMKIVQRSHDIGWSGWASLLTLLPLTVLIWYCVPGEKGNNAYGLPTRVSFTVKAFSFTFIGLMVSCGAVGLILANAPLWMESFDAQLRSIYGLENI